MLQKIVTVLIVLSLLPVFLYAQERTILRPKGVTILHKGNSGNLEVIPLTKWEKLRMQRTQVNKNINWNSSNSDNPLNLIDTLYLVTDPTLWFSNFGFFGQDRMVMWFEAPADLFLNEVGFAFYSAYVPVANVEMKIVAVNYTREELEYLSTEWVGSYEALGNGYHDITAFLDDPDITGPWVPVTPGTPEVFGNDIWSDLGVGLTFTPITDSVNQGYQFIDLSALGYPDIAAGTIFGVVLKNTAPGLNASRVGIWGTTVNGGNQVSLWKFYADDNTNQPPTNDWGWWSRDMTLGFAAVVDIYGNTPPDINSFTVLQGGSLGPFTVNADITDENPGDPTQAGVASAMIQWSTDEGTTWNDVSMTGAEPDFTGEIPVQPAYIKITYRISSTDVTNLTSVSSVVNFYTFAPSGAPTLVIFNGFSDPSDLPYWGEAIGFEHDVWVSGGIPDINLLNNYTNIFEIWNEGNGVYNQDLIRQWLDADGSRNYMLAGQEWLGAKNAYTDSTYSAGSFEYDILGVSHSYNDISFDGTTGQNIPTLVTPQAGTLFGQQLLDLFNSLTPPADSMMYNPTFETGNINWQDAFDVVSGVEVDMMVETRGIQGVTNVQTLPTMAHHTLTAGNKIIFHAYDPIALNTAVNDTYPYYYWVGPDTLNSVFQALRWFDITITGIKEVGGALPTEFVLEQNYPNPFNPTTTIKFSIPEQSKITLKIYDVLGSEVSTLVNELRNAGSYEVNFDASNLASGLYMYTLNTGNYFSSKKMMLLK